MQPKSHGLQTRLTFDARQRLTSQTIISAQGNATTRISYDAKGNATGIQLPDGQILQYTYDLVDRLTRISNDLGEAIEFTLDADGNRTSEITSAADESIVRVQNRVFDGLSRLIQSIGAASQTTNIGYDKNDNLNAIENALGQQTHMDFDGLNRLIGITDALQGESRFTYDALDNLIQVIDATGIATHYDYDGLNNLVTETSTARGTTHYGYDAAGNQVSVLDANSITSNYQYDALNRLTDITYVTSELENIPMVMIAAPSASGS